jgi:hypothetical protein
MFGSNRLRLEPSTGHRKLNITRSVYACLLITTRHSIFLPGITSSAILGNVQIIRSGSEMKYLLISIISPRPSSAGVTVSVRRRIYQRGACNGKPKQWLWFWTETKFSCCGFPQTDSLCFRTMFTRPDDSPRCEHPCNKVLPNAWTTSVRSYNDKIG